MRNFSNSQGRDSRAAMMRQQLTQPNVSKTYLDASNPAKQLLTGEGISNLAVNSDNFGSGRAGNVGLAAQLATAGVGAFTQYRARKGLAEQELASQNAFATQFPEFAELAGQLSPETRQAYTLEVLKKSLKDPETQILPGEQGYFSVNKETNQATPVMGPNGQLIKPQKTGTTVNVGEQQEFKNATTLRSEYSDKSKNFIGVRENYEKTKESLADPSPAGDISAVFAFMKTLDPASTVREGEFAQLSNAKPLLEKYGLQSFENVWKGERLTPSQRSDIENRSKKLYDRAELSQKKLASQYTSIAQRNKLDPQDIIIDSSTTIEQPPASEVQGGQTLNPTLFKDVGNDLIAAEIAKRSGGRK